MVDRKLSASDSADPVNQSALEQTILALLAQRAPGATICPSEAARAYFGEAHWRPCMEQTRRAARALVDQGKILILQKGQVVDPSTAKGPIRLRARSPQTS